MKWPIDYASEGDSGLDNLIRYLTSIRGLGPWTASCSALRTRQPGAFPGTDLGLQRTFQQLTGRPELDATATNWSPWRALAAFHLCMSSD